MKDELVDECPSCGKVALLSEERIGAVSFTEPICGTCREKELVQWQMDSFDIAYERARANGWPD
jgi:endogenous inhibitor of DNA gyrase (YacG/DUF329 family)